MRHHISQVLWYVILLLYLLHLDHQLSSTFCDLFMMVLIVVTATVTPADILS